MSRHLTERKCAINFTVPQNRLWYLVGNVIPVSFRLMANLHMKYVGLSLTMFSRLFGFDLHASESEV